MKATTRLGLLVVVGLPALLVLAAEPRHDQWQRVEEAMKKGLPKTAIERLNPIIEAAIRDKAYPEAIKAIARKIALAGNIEGNKPEEKITRMQAEIAKAPKEMVPVMEAILANWYWHYFQQNRWHFMQRTTTAEAPGPDITTWDLRRIFAEIDRQFGRALATEKELKAIPIATYEALLDKGTMPDVYRPTLFDFVAHEALNFYTLGEQGLTQAEDHFDLQAATPIFGTVDEFLKWDIRTTDADSRTVKAIKLYQGLLRFHQGDKDRSAFLDADLDRLGFAFNQATGEEKSARCKAALQAFAERERQHETSAMARHRWASVLQGENELVEARRVALEGSQAFPDSPGGKLCFNLVQQIEAPSSRISTERVWTRPWPTIGVSYRNTTKVHFRALKADWVARLKGSGRPEQLQQNEAKRLLAHKPDREWSADLPATQDYRERQEEVPVPRDLQPGFYFLIASHEPKFSPKNNVVSITDFWVSDLALVLRIRQQPMIEGLVLQAGSGVPVAGADVRIWVRDAGGKPISRPALKTDAKGLFSLRLVAPQGYLVLASHQGQQLATGQDLATQPIPPHQEERQRTIFFTDRALYRPGQTIRYKGLSIRFDPDKDDYATLANVPVAVVLADPNGKEVARQQQRTNAYGSFSGSFTAPRDRVMGQMNIHVEAGPHGATHFNVEEYKRPKFEVKLEAPKVAAKLNGPVKLQGKATAYTGAAIGGARVSFRVVRQVQYPPWLGWCGWWTMPPADSQEIAHGTTVSAADGTFPIEFVARPDPTVPEKTEPAFHFTVQTDVTDTNGETRSANRLVKVAYTALTATLTADEWQTEDQAVKIRVATETHDGEGQAARATLKVCKLKQPDKVQRAPLTGHHFHPVLPYLESLVAQIDPGNPHTWALGDTLTEQAIRTDAQGKAEATVKLEAGVYRALLETKDRFGKTVTALLPIQVVKPEAKNLDIRIANLLAAPKWTVEPGQEFQALWGTGYDQGRAFVEIEHRQKVIRSFWTDAQATQALVTQKVTEAMRGGFTLRVTMVRENRAYFSERQVNVPWSNKDLTVKWEHFVSKLGPTQKETWTAVVAGPDAKKAVAEMVATLYDQSLDAYLPHHWPRHFGVFRKEYAGLSGNFENQMKFLQHLQGSWPGTPKEVRITYRALPVDISANRRGYEYLEQATWSTTGMTLTIGGFGGLAGACAPLPAAELPERAGDARGARGGGLPLAPPVDPAGRRAARPELDQVSARKNLNETAFFFPHLVSGEDGTVKLEFAMPEALTRWKFMGFAHDRALRAGYLEDEAVTSKDLMVQPNPPRFVREGDTLEFTVKVSNQSSQAQKGTVRLTLADARTGQSVDTALGNTIPDQAFEVPSKESRSCSWRLRVPDGLGPLTYKAVGAAEKLSDGEEGFLPVLSRYVLVTESLPLPIRGAQTKTFEFGKLRDSQQSTTLKHQSLTVQMVSNPSWYAVMALPYLMEYPYECSEQIFNRLYANALARHIATSDPKIRKVFDQWRDTPALDSPLEKNQDLKAAMLEETPWLRQAMKESQTRRNVGILFDDNRLNEETARTFRKLAEMQLPDGSWPWFPGGRGNDYITLYVTTGFGRLRHLGVKVDTEPAVKSLARLDGWIDHIYRDILKHGRKDKNNLSPTIALYLYGRSFFLADRPIDPKAKEAVDYFLAQARTHWLQLANRQSQAHLAVALKRFGDQATPGDILKSIKERSVSNEELGMFWRDTELSYWWYRAPIETQAMMIEAFDEVMKDPQAVEACKVWLLKQKQTQDWKTTKATADAIYALLLRGDNVLRSDALVEVALGGTKIEPAKVEAGTGFYEHRFVRGEINSQLSQITVRKTDEGVAWGSVHWQYLEDVGKVTPHEGTPLKLTKTLYTRQYTKQGPVLQPVRGPVQIGDELVVRVTIKVDRDMEYVHLKDHRGSGTEPVNVLSQYRYQDGLAYYESTRDTASHFFIDYLPKGTYVFEYATRAVHRGQYQTGMAQIQCMYAPEFNSHSESLPLDVK